LKEQFLLPTIQVRCIQEESLIVDESGNQYNYQQGYTHILRSYIPDATSLINSMLDA